MKACGFALVVLLSLCVGGAATRAQSAGGAAPHVAPAQAVVGQHPRARWLFERLCVARQPVRAA